MEDACRYGDAGTPGCRAGRTAAEPSREPLPAVPSCACGICSPARSSRPAVSSSSPACPSCATRSPSSAPCARPAFPPPARWSGAWPLAEVALGVAAVVAPGREQRPLVAVAYAGFTAFVALTAAPRRGPRVVRLLRPARHACDPGPPGPHRGRDRDGGRARRLPTGSGGLERQPRRRPPPSPGSRRCWAPWPTWSSPCCRPRPPPPSAACRRGDSMLAVVVAEGVAIALLAVLVLGPAAQPRADPARPARARGRAGAGGGGVRPRAPRHATGPVPVELEPGVVPAARPATDRGRGVTGTTLDGAPVTRRRSTQGRRTLLAFLSSGCSVCQTFWDELSSGAVDVPGGGTARRGHQGPGARRASSRLRAAGRAPAGGGAVLRRVDRLRRARLALLRVRRGRRRHRRGLLDHLGAGPRPDGPGRRTTPAARPRRPPRRRRPTAADRRDDLRRRRPRAARRRDPPGAPQPVRAAGARPDPTLAAAGRRPRGATGR